MSTALPALSDMTAEQAFAALDSDAFAAIEVDRFDHLTQDRDTMTGDTFGHPAAIERWRLTQDDVTRWLVLDWTPWRTLVSLHETSEAASAAYSRLVGEVYHRRGDLAVAP